MALEGIGVVALEPMDGIGVALEQMEGIRGFELEELYWSRWPWRELEKLH